MFYLNVMNESNMKKVKNKLRYVGFLLCLQAAACASSSGKVYPDSPDINPSLEPVNHAIYSFNQVVDDFILSPIARAYDTVMPDFAQKLVKNFIDNFYTPVYIINYALQGEGEKAQKAFGRFALNTSLGFFGIADMASGAGLPKEPTDFGATMAKWGYQDSAYFVIPFAGPSTVRDTIGMGVDVLLNPFNIVTMNPHNDNLRTADWVRFGVETVQTRASALPLTDDIAKSLDPYTTMQSMYLQNRRHELRLDKDTNTYDFDFDMDEE